MKTRNFVSNYILTFSIILLFLLPGSLFAQSSVNEQALIASAGSFTGAKANKKHYQAVYQLNSDDPKTIEATLRNIKNAMDDPRLKGKLEVELVAFSGGWEVFNKENPYKEKLLELTGRGVILAQCHNTMVERHISKDQIFPFVSIVPSGNGELIIREAEGWSIVKP